VKKRLIIFLIIDSAFLLTIFLSSSIDLVAFLLLFKPPTAPANLARSLPVNPSLPILLDPKPPFLNLHYIIKALP